MRRPLFILLLLTAISALLLFKAELVFASHRGAPAAPAAPQAPATPVISSQPPIAPEAPEAPEAPGIYDVPGYPGMKVRVYAHPEKPKVATNSLLVCNLADPDSTATVSAAGWKLPAAVTYNLNPGSAPSSFLSSNLPTFTATGFNVWSTAVAGKVSFTRGPNTTVTRSTYDGRNIVAWGRISSSSLGITYIRYYPSTGQVVDVDTILNRRYGWSWSNSNTCADTNTYDAQNILTHEQGHWLGLDDEYDASQFQHATMFGYGSKGEAKKNTLTSGDTAGVSSIY